MAHNIADLFEHAVDAAPDALALIMGDRRVTLGDLERESNRLAHHLQGAGVQPGDHVAVYSKNSIEYAVSILAICKIRAVNVNVNYRYVEGELDYLFENADVTCLLAERTYAPLVATTFPRHDKLHHVVVMPDSIPGEGPEPDISSFDGVLWDDALAGESDARDFAQRSPDDLYIIYTGGTTGFPKGVMWRQEDFWRVLCGGIDFMTGEPVVEGAQAEQAALPGRMSTFPMTPLMHGAAQASLMMHLFAGHATILEPRFDPARTWELIERENVQMIFFTGDALGRPLIEEYERQAASGAPYDGSSLFAISSSGALFSPAVKERWMSAFPHAIFTDSIGASETGFQGTGIQAAGQIGSDGPIVNLGPHMLVLDDANRPLDVTRDVGMIGRLARGGHVPVGYYKDEVKSAATFVEIDGERYSIPGDMARIETEGRVTMLGRGSNCVNTGGEKVFPEEVEMAIKRHPAVYDCLVVGLPDETYGQAVAAVVELREGEAVELEELREFLRAHLSGYKLPRTLTVVPQIPRNATGKAQYAQAREAALTSLESTV
ncbi:acyl-CoA synthetase [Nocardioides acrostichi]|uniref:Acyl-CoA synthetase n=1 Tax=Nocardioides acrostichi TaxID=2784339 RepID=A0A930Y7I4_9ACTN|nr:acyl-CoA synthetase [Nocardioides acrostichi]MBF4162067.1 acyl-CoA synthetase [Nocardioides acrostichi]